MRSSIGVGELLTALPPDQGEGAKRRTDAIRTAKSLQEKSDKGLHLIIPRARTIPPHRLDSARRWEKSTDVTMHLCVSHF